MGNTSWMNLNSKTLLHPEGEIHFLYHDHGFSQRQENVIPLTGKQKGNFSVPYSKQLD